MRSEDVLALNVRRSFRPGMGAKDVYEVARRAWKLNPDGCPDIAVAHVQGEVVGAWRITGWEPSPGEPGRWQFTGTTDAALDGRYIGRDIRSEVGRSPNPVRKVTIVIAPS